MPPGMGWSEGRRMMGWRQEDEEGREYQEKERPEGAKIIQLTEDDFLMNQLKLSLERKENE